MKVVCRSCWKKYEPHASNMRIVGPNLEYTCPFCNKFNDRKLNKFVEIQTDPEFEMARLDRARIMIAMAQEIEKAVVEELEKGRKKNDKKDSNLRDRGAA